MPGTIVPQVLFLDTGNAGSQAPGRVERSLYPAQRYLGGSPPQVSRHRGKSRKAGVQPRLSSVAIFWSTSLRHSETLSPASQAAQRLCNPTLARARIAFGDFRSGGQRSVSGCGLVGYYGHQPHATPGVVSCMIGNRPLTGGAKRGSFPSLAQPFICGGVQRSRLRRGQFAAPGVELARRSTSLIRPRGIAIQQRFGRFADSVTAGSRAWAACRSLRSEDEHEGVLQKAI